MNANIVSIFGPLKGATFTLQNAEITIGRDVSNSISIVDPLLSRKHCAIRREEDGYKILDLNSRNGIFVNSVPTSGVLLKHGDEIELGDSLFIFLLLDQPEAFTARLDQALIGTMTQEVNEKEALYLNPDQVLKDAPSTQRALHDLSVLLKISSVINSIQEIGTLQHKLLQLTFKVIPANRGAILMSPADPDNLSQIYAIDENSIQIKNISVSRDIVLRAATERTAILSNDVKSEKDPNCSAIQSILCVPLIAYDNLQGVLYFDSSNPKISFDGFHLQLLWGIASVAAVALKNAVDKMNLIEENVRLQGQIESSMVGESSAITKIHQLIAKTAPKDSTVLICGESGTGKELVARAIHQNSSRAAMPFVAINCASLGETLLESELFGHEKGAFTGAIAQKKGKLEIADRGTIFLDEVSEIPTNVQAKLLRVIQEREFERIGGTRTIQINVRFIAATNRNLEQAIRSGSFRQDLYYRLNVIRIDVPPLRERNEDIPLLAKYFVSKYSKALQRRVKGVSPEALDCLLQHDWPGNVRELENLIERAVVLGSTEMILPEDLPDVLVENSPKLKSGFIQSVKESKKKLVQKALQQAEGNYQKAAEILGVHPNYLYSLLRNLGLKKD